MKKFIIITTINPKSKAILAYEQKKDWHIVVVGDRKSHDIQPSENLTFLSVEDQLKLNYQFAAQCPFNHYARKNIGYLYALEQGADIVYDTDDDNIPYEEWEFPPFDCDNAVISDAKYINIFKYFTGEFIWPRGLPYDEIQLDDRGNGSSLSIERSENVNVGVWQGQVDDEPDTDAIYRLVINKKIKFDKKEPVYLGRGSFCPVNSQNTAWNRRAFPYLYLPATVNFRFTDILRGYIAQALMWRQGLFLGFTSATVYQDRNPHDIMKDFIDESESYIHIKKIVKILENLDYTGNSLEDMRAAYGELCRASIVNTDELALLDSWIDDYKKML